MSNKLKILICIVILLVIIIFWVRRNSNGDAKSSQLNSMENVYDLMMDTLPRNIIGIDPSEMSSDEQEFYYKYLYDNTVEKETYYDYENELEN